MKNEDDSDYIEVNNSNCKNELLLDFMIKDYEHEVDRRNVLDNKSGSLIAFSGIILTFQGALTSFVFSNLNNWIIELKIIILLFFIGSLILYTASLYFFIKAYSVSKWLFVPSNNITYADFKDEDIEKEEIIVETIHFYNKSIDTNGESLYKKAEKIKKGMKFLQAGIIITVIYISLYCINLVIYQI